MGKVKVIGSVLFQAAAVSAPQAGWWLLSQERHALSAAQVETAVRQELEVASAIRLDRVECQPIERPPGTSICDVQEDDVISGLVYEIGRDGKAAVYKIKSGELEEREVG